VDDVPYTVRRSDRARHPRIEVRPEGVEVVVPRRMALRRVAPFVAEKQRWIERSLRKMREAEAEVPAARLRDGGCVPFLGEEVVLWVWREPGRRRPHVALRDDGFRVKLPPRGDLRGALERWFRREAREEIGARLDDATARAGVDYTRLDIRGQRTRWASCSAESGAMSFNWRLLLAPEPVVDYVVEHEVAHLEVPDHSNRFWSLLARRCPDYREHERWLRRYGPTLRL
jgi:predicted metal-dependent hydrolase